MRQITERVALAICCVGLEDSAAAIVTTSAPMKLNMVVNKAPITAPKPFGMKPP
ncbi:hypothetical protein D3C85_1832520 [compost metagenome]